MITCEVIEKFNLGEFNKLKNIKRKGIDKKGTLFVGDTFECDKEMADYLTGNNANKKVVVKIIEVTPEEIKEEKVEVIEDPYYDYEESKKKNKKKKDRK